VALPALLPDPCEPAASGVRHGGLINLLELYVDSERRERSGVVPVSASFRRRSLVRWGHTSCGRRVRLSQLLMSTPAPLVSDSPPYQKPESGEGRR
jgi:hypothetical protein